VHLWVAAWLIGRLGPTPPTDLRVPIQPMLRAAIKRETTNPVEKESERVDGLGVSAAGLQSAQPDAATVQRTVRRALAVKSFSAAPDNALDRLADKAAMLEQISSPAEIAKMAGEITRAMGVTPWEAPTTSAPASDKPFDFETAVLVDITREETGERTTLREVFSQRDGRTAALATIRERTPDGAFRYRQTIVDPARPDDERKLVFEVAAEDFDAVESRRGPFEVIRKYPLMRQLHRSAVVPLLEKLSQESPRPAPTAPVPADSKSRPGHPTTRP